MRKRTLCSTSRMSAVPAPDQLAKAFHLPGREAYRRLVEQKQARPQRQREARCRDGAARGIRKVSGGAVSTSPRPHASTNSSICIVSRGRGRWRCADSHGLSGQARVCWNDHTMPRRTAWAIGQGPRAPSGDVAARGGDEAGHHVDERGLACTVRANQAVGLAVRRASPRPGRLHRRSGLRCCGSEAAHGVLPGRMAATRRVAMRRCPSGRR